MKIIKIKNNKQKNRIKCIKIMEIYLFIKRCSLFEKPFYEYFQKLNILFRCLGENFKTFIVIFSQQKGKIK